VPAAPVRAHPRNARGGGDALALVEVKMDAHHAAAGEGAHLNQVAELVHEPEAVAPYLPQAGRLAPCERRVDLAAVAHLGNERVVLDPRAQDAAAAAVADAVAGQLAHGQHEVLR